MPINPVDVVGNFQRGYQFGTAQKEQRRVENDRHQLRNLAPKVLQGDTSAFNQAAAINPGAATELQDAGDRQYRRLGNVLGIMRQAVDSGNPQAKQMAFSKVRPFLVELTGQEGPAQWDDSMLPAFEQIEQRVKMAQSEKPEQQGMAPRVVGNALVDAQGRVLYQAPQEPDYQWSDSRGVWIPKPTGALPGGVPTTNPITGTDFGIGETNNYVKSILGKVGRLDPNATPEQQAERILPYLIQQESGGNPNAVSPKGAQGLTQVMPATGQDPGFGVRPLQNTSPEENVRFGRDYLTAMLRRYPGRPDLALAAYNAGPAVADRFVGQQASIAGPAAIPVAGVGPRQDDDAPSGYRWNAGRLEPIPGGPADKQNNPVAADLAKGEMGMRKELQDRVEKDRSILNMYQNVQNAANSPSAAGDLSLIFAFMKMLDPGSVVREQEFANAQNAAGVPDQIRNAYNKALNGQRLNPQQRADFVSQAQGLASAAQQRITGVTREYQGIADQYGWDPVRATGMADFRGVQATSGSGPSAPAQSGPQPGTVEDGYRFRGGDPSDPNNWERQ